MEGIDLKPPRSAVPASRERMRGLIDGITVAAIVLVVLQLEHQLRFGWLATLLWWLTFTAGQVTYELISRYQRHRREMYLALPGRRGRDRSANGGK